MESFRKLNFRYRMSASFGSLSTDTRKYENFVHVSSACHFCCHCCQSRKLLQINHIRAETGDDETHECQTLHGHQCVKSVQSAHDAAMMMMMVTDAKITIAHVYQQQLCCNTQVYCTH